MTSSGRIFEGGGSSSLSILLLEGPVGHWVGDDEELLLHHLLYTFIYTVITIFLFSISVNSFISTHKFHFVFFLILSPIPLGSGGVSK